MHSAFMAAAGPAITGAAPIDSADLTTHAVLRHFADAPRSVPLLTYLLALDRQDQHALDFNEGQQADPFALQLLWQELGALVDASVPLLHRMPHEFAELLARLSTTRCLYLLRFAAQRNADVCQQLNLLAGAQGDATAAVALIQRRLEAYSRAQLLGKIFSGERLTRITKIMGSYSDV